MGRKKRCIDKKDSGSEEDRTPNLLIANQALSQLSYRPIVSFHIHGIMPDMGGANQIDELTTIITEADFQDKFF